MFVLGLATVKAVEVEGLYQVDVEVSDQTQNKRWGAVLEGFKEILVRKSGSGQVLTSDEVKRAYRKVTAYVLRYEYAPNPDPESENPFLLRLNFEPRLIDQLISQAGMPIWGSNRPVTILWLAQEENFQRQVITDVDSEGLFYQLLYENAERRGIPVILPLMDLEDELNVSISDVWGRFNTPVINASQRYAADSIVTGRIERSGEQWIARVSYINQLSERRLEVTEPTPELLMQSMTDRISEFLCEKYCVVETIESHQVTMQVSNVGNFASFKGVQNYLEDLSSIRKVEVEKIASSTVRFKISLLGDLQSVRDGISLSNKLVEEMPPSEDPFARAVIESSVENEFEADSSQEEPVKVALSEEETSELLRETGDSLEQLQLLEQTPEADSLDPEQTLIPQHSEQVLFFRWLG